MREGGVYTNIWATACQPLIPAHAPEHLLEERGHPCSRVFTDLDLFLGKHDKEAIQRPVGHVLIEIETNGFCKGDVT